MRSFVRNFCFTAAIGLSACLVPDDGSELSPVANNSLIIRAGVLEIDPIDGSFVTENCGMNKNDLSTPEYGCVAYPFASEDVDGKNWDSDYLRLLKKDGWAFAGGEGNTYYLEKPIDENCSHFLGMIGWLQGTEAEIKKYFNEGELGPIVNGVFIFALDEPQRVAKIGVWRNKDGTP